MTHETSRIVCYVLDVAVILSIVIAGIYFFEHPEKIDAFLDWTVGSYYRSDR